jgi:teichuronic acid biosynthesis glycosyltransferase TuaG
MGVVPRADNPLVSIVTPAYNAARHVRQAIESARNQTCSNWEMLVVDDCSTDDTCAVVEALAASDPRIRLIRRPVNGGPARARQAALEVARGRYIAFLDSDDWWLPQKLERQLAFMRDRGIALSYTRFRRVAEDGSGAGRPVVVPASLDYRGLLGNTAMATSTVVVDRALTGPFSMTETYYDDFVLWLALLKRGHTAHGLLEDLMRYRVAGGSWSRDKLRSALWVWRTYRRIEKLPLMRAAWHFARYAWHALAKYRTF